MTPDRAELKRIAEAQDDGLAKRLEEEASVLRNADQVLFQSTIPTRDGPSRLLSNALIMSEAASLLRSRAARIEALEAGLKPFAEAATDLDKDLPPDLRAEDDMSIEGALYEHQQPTVGDIRRAANLLGDRHE